MSDKLKDIVDSFKQGELDVESIFGNYNSFFNFLDKNGLLSDIEPQYPEDWSDWLNEYLIWLLDNDQTIKFINVITKIFDDITFDEKGNAFLEISDLGELSTFFCSNPRDISQEFIKGVLEGESDFFDSWGYNSTDNIYRDVILELNNKNLQILKNKILDELKDTKLDPQTESMELIAKNQGHEEFWEINEDNIKNIFENEDSIKILLKENLPDIFQNLEIIYNYSYNSAYESMVYETIWSELGEFFDGQGTWESKPHPYKKNTQLHYKKIPINNFFETIYNYLNRQKKDSLYHSINFQYSKFLYFLKDQNECLKLYIRDYPDSKEIDENINSYFNDYF